MRRVHQVHFRIRGRVLVKVAPKSRKAGGSGEEEMNVSHMLHRYEQDLMCVCQRDACEDNFAPHVILLREGKGKELAHFSSACEVTHTLLTLVSSVCTLLGC